MPLQTCHYKLAYGQRQHLTVKDDYSAHAHALPVLYDLQANRREPPHNQIHSASIVYCTDSLLGLDQVEIPTSGMLALGRLQFVSV